jgi:UDP-N-acetylglucosamine transferase subunit ALG13
MNKNEIKSIKILQEHSLFMIYHVMKQLQRFNILCDNHQLPLAVSFFMVSTQPAQLTTQTRSRVVETDTQQLSDKIMIQYYTHKKQTFTELSFT